MAIAAIANDFFAACETGRGWEVCKTYCAPNATFAAQAEPLADIKTLAEYADWMKGLMIIMPDGSYEVKSFATDTFGSSSNPNFGASSRTCGSRTASSIAALSFWIRRALSWRNERRRKYRSIRYRRDATPTVRHGMMTYPPTTATIIATFLSLAGASDASNAAEKDQAGIASTYSGKGGKTTSGEKTDSEGMTAAHRSLPFGTIVRVTNSQNDRFVLVRINDRGPFTRGRVIDLTPAAARVLGFSGLARVRLSVVAATP